MPGIGRDVEEIPIAKVGVIGAGTMGGGIAMNMANVGIPVTIVETGQEALDRGLGIIRKNYENTARKGRIGSLAVRMSEAVSWFESEVLEIEPARLTELVAEEPGLEIFEHFFHNIHRSRAHTLTADKEALLAGAGLMSRGASQVFNAFDNADLELGTITDEDGKPDAGAKEALGTVEKRMMREMILGEGVRTDGRDLTTVRPITVKPGILPRTHGSALFTRGETQVLGFDMTTNDSLVMPIRKDYEAHDDPTLLRVQKQGFFGWAEIGFACLDSRMLGLGVIDRSL